MKKIFIVVFAVVVVLIFGACATYNLNLMSDENLNKSMYTQRPNYVNMLVRVTDRQITTTDADGKVIPDFSNPKYYVVGLEQAIEGDSKGNFSVLENGVEVKVEAGLRVVPLEELELHINLVLDVSGSVGEVGLLQAKNAIKRLIARPATEAEITADDPGNFTYRYSDWDNNAKSFVERTEVWKSILTDNQIVTIYTFSDTVKKIKLREADRAGKRYPDKARQILDTIDTDISLGVDSTNLYGALLAGLEDLAAVRTLNDPRQGFVDGIVVAFTDGSHTSGNINHRGKMYTPEEAINRIHNLRGELTDLQSLRVITIAVRSPELQESITSGELARGGLRDIQNSGYLRVNDYNALNTRFAEAFELIDRYTRSLYWIFYRSPKAGSQKVEIQLRVDCPLCKKDPGGKIPTYATVIESIQTNGFYQVLPGVYINDPILDDEGNVAQMPDAEGNNLAVLGPKSIEIVTDEELSISKNRIYSLILANNPDQKILNPGNTALLRMHTYVRANNNRYKPEYRVSSSDDSVVSVIGYAALTPIESVALIEGRKAGTATIEVIDTANGNIKKTIIVRSRVE